MWQAFELIHATFKAGAELYLEDMLPALDNFVQYGSQHLISTPPYLEAMFSMVHHMFTDEKVGGVDRICACKLAEGMMLSLRGHIDQHVMAFVRLTSTFSRFLVMLTCFRSRWQCEHSRTRKLRSNHTEFI
jgi:hypothetical protein